MIDDDTTKAQRIIAIVDDDPGMQISLSVLLAARGFQTSVFSSAEDWLERGASGHVDCMVLDIDLGGRSKRTCCTGDEGAQLINVQ